MRNISNMNINVDELTLDQAFQLIDALPSDGESNADLESDFENDLLEEGDAEQDLLEVSDEDEVETRFSSEDEIPLSTFCTWRKHSFTPNLEMFSEKSGPVAKIFLD